MRRIRLILLFKDVEMAHDERLVENNGTTTPWLGDQQGSRSVSS